MAGQVMKRAPVPDVHGIRTAAVLLGVWRCWWWLRCRGAIDAQALIHSVNHSGAELLTARTWAPARWNGGEKQARKGVFSCREPFGCSIMDSTLNRTGNRHHHKVMQLPRK